MLIGHVVFAFPFVFILLRIALDRLDRSVEDVARDLGAGPWTVFKRVTLPQIAPVLAGAAALAFMLSFDEFLITFFVIGNDQTLPVYIFGRLRRTVDPGHQRRLDAAAGDHDAGLGRRRDRHPACRTQ